MKPLLLCLLLAGCAAPKPDAVIQLCAAQIVRVVSDEVFVAREHCEPDGEKS